jgi:FkbM family methyltransferase
MKILKKLRDDTRNFRQMLWARRHFSNWLAIWTSMVLKRQPPPLKTRQGNFILSHAAIDQPLFLYREMFDPCDYLADGFYKPGTNDTVVDIGANIGFFAHRMLSENSKITVHCFEPVSSTRERLQTNVTNNRLTASVHIYPYAVSRFSGEAHIQMTDSSLRATVVTCSNLGAELVQCITLSDALRLCAPLNRIALLKIDAEGSEVDILSGADTTDWSRIDRVALEYHDNLRPGSKSACLSILESHRLSLFRLEEHGNGTGVILATCQMRLYDQASMDIADC